MLEGQEEGHNELGRRQLPKISKPFLKGAKRNHDEDGLMLYLIYTPHGTSRKKLVLKSLIMVINELQPASFILFFSSKLLEFWNPRSENLTSYTHCPPLQIVNQIYRIQSNLSLRKKRSVWMMACLHRGEWRRAQLQVYFL